MVKDNGQSWQAIEEQAYLAFREWPIWLLLRQQELAIHLQEAHAPTRAPDAQADGTALQSK